MIFSDPWWLLLLAVVGPGLIAFAVALVFAPIQLEVLDLFPHQRGAAASLGTFFGLVLNALLAVPGPLAMAAMGTAMVAGGVESISLMNPAGRSGASHLDPWLVEHKPALFMEMIDTADVYSAWVPGHKGGESEGVIGRWLKA